MTTRKNEAATPPQQFPTKEPNSIVADASSNVNPLRELRLSKEIPAADMVTIVKELFPGYNKSLQSKCERTQYYGIQLCGEAMQALYQAYDHKKSKPPNRKNPCRLVCRVSVEDYNRVKALMERQGYSTVQDWLYTLIKKYLKEKYNDKH